MNGVSTWGGWELLVYLEDVFYDTWLYTANEVGLGLGMGLLFTSFAVKFVFTPLIVYSQMTGYKFKLL